MTTISDERLVEMKSRLQEQIRLLDVRLSRSAIPEDATEYAERMGEAELKLSLVTELQSLRAQSGVRVKPLEWGATSYGAPEATTVAGIYRITNAWDGGFNVNRGQISFQDEDGRKNFPNIEAAKAAAQADYERRILSSLEASPAPVSEEVRFDAMFAALEAAEAKGQTSHDPLQDKVNKTFAAIDAYRAALAAKGGQ